MAKQKLIVTLNVGSQRIGMGLFSAAPNGGLVLQDYQFSELLGDPATDSARIPQVRVAVNDLVERIGVKHQPVRYAISGHSVFTRFVKLPSLDEEQVDQIVEFEAQQNVPFPIDEVVWDYQLVGTGEGGEVEVVLVAIKSDSLNDLNDAVEESTLQTQNVDVAPMALYNAFRYSYSDVTDPVVLIDVGARTTNLVYAYGNRVFTRSTQVGGTAATLAIAKEFELPFGEAEERKIKDGFVALGGAYADHENPEIATMSKVIRNTMTRLHSEVVRTTSAFRQQGGMAPKQAYLCGGSAALPYLREFFNEKLNIPVEYFNPLKNVSVGPKVDVEDIGKEAHTLGELIGMGLRQVSACPMEIDLVPERVEARKDLASRKPFLITAGACVLSMLAAGGVYFAKANSLTEEKLGTLKAKYNTLNGYYRKIRKEDQSLMDARMKAHPLVTAVKGRTLPIDMLTHLNSKLQSDRIWLTQIEPLINGQPEDAMRTLVPDSNAGRLFKVEERKKERLKRGQKAPPRMIDGIRVYGLYRDGNLNNVFQYYKALEEDPKFFDFEGKQQDDILNPKSGNADQFWAEMFKMDIPLKDPIPAD